MAADIIDIIKHNTMDITERFEANMPQTPAVNATIDSKCLTRQLHARGCESRGKSAGGHPTLAHFFIVIAYQENI